MGFRCPGSVLLAVPAGPSLAEIAVLPIAFSTSEWTPRVLAVPFLVAESPFLQPEPFLPEPGKSG